MAGCDVCRSSGNVASALGGIQLRGRPGDSTTGPRQRVLCGPWLSSVEQPSFSKGGTRWKVRTVGVCCSVNTQRAAPAGLDQVQSGSSCSFTRGFCCDLTVNKGDECVCMWCVFCFIYSRCVPLYEDKHNRNIYILYVYVCIYMDIYIDIYM